MPQNFHFFFYDLLEESTLENGLDSERNKMIDSGENFVFLLVKLSKEK